MGEGNISLTSPFVSLFHSIFIVGKVKSSKPKPMEEGDFNGFCATDWLGELPLSLQAVTEFSDAMFPPLSSFFKAEREAYRAFFCRTNKSLRRVPLFASALIDFNDDTQNEHDWQLVKVLNSAIISHWAKLDPEHDGTSNDWLTEGGRKPDHQEYCIR